MRMRAAAERGGGGGVLACRPGGHVPGAGRSGGRDREMLRLLEKLPPGRALEVGSPRHRAGGSGVPAPLRQAEPWQQPAFLPSPPV